MIVSILFIVYYLCVYIYASASTLKEINGGKQRREGKRKKRFKAQNQRRQARPRIYGQRPGPDRLSCYGYMNKDGTNAPGPPVLELKNVAQTPNASRQPHLRTYLILLLIPHQDATYSVFDLGGVRVWYGARKRLLRSLVSW